MLALRPSCECCDRDLPPDSAEAMICTFECTFCASCADDVLGGVCSAISFAAGRGWKIDKAYANFKRIQRAAAGVGTEDGVFTPAQLLSAAKAMDRTKDKRAFSEGTALLQDLAAAGKEVMPSKIPDSGTAGRMRTSGIGARATGRRARRRPPARR